MYVCFTSALSISQLCHFVAHHHRSPLDRGKDKEVDENEDWKIKQESWA